MNALCRCVVLTSLFFSIKVRLCLCNIYKVRVSGELCEAVWLVPYVSQLWWYRARGMGKYLIESVIEYCTRVSFENS